MSGSFFFCHAWPFKKAMTANIPRSIPRICLPVPEYHHVYAKCAKIKPAVVSQWPDACLLLLTRQLCCEFICCVVVLLKAIQMSTFEFYT